MRAWLVVGLMALIAAAGAQAQPQRADIRAGQRLAQRVCDGCHVVAANQELSPLVPNYGPSFFAIADRPTTTARSLASFLSHPHALARMPYPDLTPAQIADVSAYILSLRGRR